MQTNDWCWIKLLQLYSSAWNHLTVLKKKENKKQKQKNPPQKKPNKKQRKNESELVLKMLITKCVYKSYIFNIYV